MRPAGKERVLNPLRGQQHGACSPGLCFWVDFARYQQRSRIVPAFWPTQYVSAVQSSPELPALSPVLISRIVKNDQQLVHQIRPARMTPPAPAGELG